MSGKIACLLDRLKNTNRRWSESLNYWTDPVAPAVPVGEGGVAQYPDSAVLRGPTSFTLGPNETRTVIQPVTSGLLGTHYWCPTKFAPLTIELELVQTPSQCCARGSVAPSAPVLSQSFSLQDVRLLADVCTVDSAIMEQLSSTLLEGGALPMHFSTWGSNTMHTLSLSGNENQSWSVTLSRAFSRIKTIFITFTSDAAYSVADTEYSLNLCWNGRVNYTDYYGAGGANPYLPNCAEGWRFQFQTGSLLIPQIPMGSTQEAWYHLAKLLGHHGSLESVSIPPGEWVSRDFIIGLDLEKAAATPGAMSSFSGLSTMDSGSTMRFDFQNVNCRNDTSRPQRMYIFVQIDAVLEIRAEGCVLLN
jgi:hypothetical protein